MPTELQQTLRRQFDTAWRLTDFHLATLTTAECLWRPAATGLHVQLLDETRWAADWPTHEGYDLGPSSIAWITWHIDFWWSMVLNHSTGDATLTRDAILWPGTADAVRARLHAHQRAWIALLDDVDDSVLQRSDRTNWPFRERPFSDIVAWVNIELTKNAAELGYARFLFHASHP